jgi:hypothetical protein
MPPLMGYRLISPLLLVVVLVSVGACGYEIGDACVFSSDCSTSGDRICIDPPSGDDETDAMNPWKGYCTIQGCDYSTCPDEAVCVRFFSGNFTKTCMNSDECSLDELCAVDGHCAARSSEVRYCMRTCDSDGDCRDGYECRDLAKMIAHGGEPVLAPGVVVDADAPKFCAAAPLP